MDRRTPRLPYLGPILAAGLALACGSGEPPAAGPPTEPAELPEPAGELACRPLESHPEGGEPVQLFPAGDSAFGVLYAFERIVEIRGSGREGARTVILDSQGPLGVMDPAGATLIGDSLLALADRPLGRLKMITTAGRYAGFVDLGFPVQAVARAGDRLYAVRYALQPGGGPLLYRVDPESSERLVRPAGIEPMESDDTGWMVLGNLLKLASTVDGTLLAAHGVARARAFLVAPGDTRPRPLRLALEEREASRLGRRPPTPFGEEMLDRIALPVVDAAGGDAPGELAYLTRSGRRPFSEPGNRLLVRIDVEGSVRSVHRVPVEGEQIVRLRREALWVIGDREGLWGCSEPGAGG